ncbi:hypothetical protein EBB59_02260 [Lysobacter pythonis]|uniref:Uncharacterized protein n=1 Tax=Solilutibacter pythonis TaxID=2483112 RepID=A0A3M2I7Q3_9GAMM|nr:hypothetical protein EBB59_02260 [Lysobacter pythonis]
MRGLTLSLLCALALPACTPNVRPDSYSIGSVGQVNRSVGATIISARPVRIDGSRGVGTASGAAAGAVVGSNVGGSDSANVIGAIGGAVVGGIVGAAAERGASATTGIEYVVQTENGNLMSVVQGPEPALQVGAKVLLLYGSPARLIADPRN